MILPLKPSIIGMAFLKLVQDRSQNNSTHHINKSAWTSAIKNWIAMIIKMVPSWIESSVMMKHRSTITNLRANGRVWYRNIHNHLTTKSSKANHQQETMLTGSTNGTLSGGGSTIKSTRYSEIIIDRLKSANQIKRWGLLSKGVLLHNSACPHTAAHTVEILQNLKLEVLSHRAWSLDLAPSDFTCLDHSKWY